MDLRVVYGERLSEEELEKIEKGFSDIAYKAKELPPIENFCINLYQDMNSLKASIYGSLYYGCMHIDTIFVDEDLRGRGHGKELVRLAENFAVKKNCLFITVSTMDWEARGFYEKLGYMPEYERKGYIKDSILYSLIKHLS